MAETKGRYYPVFLLGILMVQEGIRRDSLKRFYVFLAGQTNEGHHDFVKKLKGVGHTEVASPEESDYLVVFCPVASRVGTDITEALNRMPVGKPTVLVVMHHTFNPNYAVAESRTHVKNLNILTVDCLFYDRRFLESNLNAAAWHKVKKYLGVSDFKNFIWSFFTHPAFEAVFWGTLIVWTLAMYITAKVLLVMID